MGITERGYIEGTCEELSLRRSSSGGIVVDVRIRRIHLVHLATPAALLRISLQGRCFPWRNCFAPNVQLVVPLEAHFVFNPAFDDRLLNHKASRHSKELDPDKLHNAVNGHFATFGGRAFVAP